MLGHIPKKLEVADGMHLDEWNRDSVPMTKDNYGVWEVTLPVKDGHPAIPHNTKVKVSCLHVSCSSLRD